MAADDLRERLAAYLDRAEAGADAWGTCTHEWLSLRQLRALLDAHSTPSEPEATDPQAVAYYRDLANHLAGGGLSEEERVALGTAYYDAPTETDAIAAVERIVREREAAALAAIRDAFWECFDPDFGGVDWRDDAAIQTFARKVAPYVNRSADR